MKNRLEEGVVADLARIYRHNLSVRSHDEAIEIEDRIYQSAENIRTRSGTSFRGWRGIKNRDGYILFFVEESDVAMIYAVYHERENWLALIEDRLTTVA